jgi:hypothetical protein
MNDLMKYKDSEARKIICWLRVPKPTSAAASTTARQYSSLLCAYDDVRARGFLLDRAEKEYDLGNKQGCAVLSHAEMYLADRIKYQSDSDPERLAIPLPQRS